MAATIPPSPSLFRILRFPLVLAGLIVAAHLLPAVWEWADWDVRFVGRMRLFAVLFTLLSPLVLVLWLAFLAPFAWKARAGVLGVLALCALAFGLALDSYEVTGDLGVHLHFVWQRRPNKELAEHRERQRE
jgi:hypothetical protein